MPCDCYSKCITYKRSPKPTELWEDTVGGVSLTTCNDLLTNRFIVTAVIDSNKIISVAVTRIPNGPFLLFFFCPPAGFLNVLIF